MPLLDIQRRYRELGRLRMGSKAQTSAGKEYPKKLTQWRLTSPSRELLDVAAHLYGGRVQLWEDSPGEGEHWELFTGADRLDVLIPPGEPLTQHWELWSGGGVERRCNGRAQQTGEPCACPSDFELRGKLAQEGKACKATTRMSVVLPRVPDLGVWRVESHGMNAAVELPGTVELLHQALEHGVLIPAQLRIDQRTAKKDGQTRHFIVPVLEIPTVTMAALRSPEGVAGLNPADVPALAGVPAGELPPAPTGPQPARSTRKRASARNEPALPPDPRDTSREEPPPPPEPPADDLPEFEPVDPSMVTQLEERIRALPEPAQELYAQERRTLHLPVVSHPERWSHVVYDMAVGVLEEIESNVANFDEELDDPASAVEAIGEAAVDDMLRERLGAVPAYEPGEEPF